MKEKRTEYNWPQLPEKYDRALRQAVRYIVRRYHPTAIIAAGTIIRGTPNKNSDLDIYVIHRRPFMQRVQKWFNGVPAEIFVNTCGSAQRSMNRQAEMGAAIAAHMIATGHIILNNELCLKRLIFESKQHLCNKPKRLSRQDDAHQRYIAATLMEDAEDTLGSDPVSASMFLDLAIEEIVRYLFHRWQMHIPRNKERLAVIATQDQVLGGLIRQYYRAGSIAVKNSMMRKIADHTIRARGFFEWESKPLKAPVNLK